MIVPKKRSNSVDVGEVKSLQRRDGMTRPREILKGARNVRPSSLSGSTTKTGYTSTCSRMDYSSRNDVPSGDLKTVGSHVRSVGSLARLDSSSRCSKPKLSPERRSRNEGIEKRELLLRKRELEVRMREVDLRERELDLRQRERQMDRTRHELSLRRRYLACSGTTGDGAQNNEDTDSRVVTTVKFEVTKPNGVEEIEESFEFELVNCRVHVRPLNPDHPQASLLGNNQRMDSCKDDPSESEEDFMCPVNNQTSYRRSESNRKGASLSPCRDRPVTASCRGKDGKNSYQRNECDNFKRRKKENSQPEVAHKNNADCKRTPVTAKYCYNPLTIMKDKAVSSINTNFDGSSKANNCSSTENYSAKNPERGVISSSDKDTDEKCAKKPSINSIIEFYKGRKPVAGNEILVDKQIYPEDSAIKQVTVRKEYIFNKKEETSGDLSSKKVLDCKPPHKRNHRICCNHHIKKQDSDKIRSLYEIRSELNKKPLTTRCHNSYCFKKEQTEVIAAFFRTRRNKEIRTNDYKHDGLLSGSFYRRGKKTSY